MLEQAVGFGLAQPSHYLRPLALAGVRVEAAAPGGLFADEGLGCLSVCFLVAPAHFPSAKQFRVEVLQVGLAVSVVEDILDIEEASVVGGGYDVHVLEGDGGDKYEWRCEVGLLRYPFQLVHSDPHDDHDIGVDFLFEQLRSLYPHSQSELPLLVAFHRHHQDIVYFLHPCEYLDHRKATSLDITRTCFKSLSQLLFCAPYPFHFDAEVGRAEAGLSEALEVAGDVNLVVVEGVEDLLALLFLLLDQGIADYQKYFDKLLFDAGGGVSAKEV